MRHGINILFGGLILLGLSGTALAQAHLPPNPVRDTKGHLRQIADALEKYRAHCGAYPVTEAGLQALAEKSACSGVLLKKIPRDGWGNFIEYASDGKTFYVKSFGRDKLPGGSGLDADIELKK
ncbi:MAG: type II secretion system protein GspG [Bdellovibrionota bacterium]